MSDSETKITGFSVADGRSRLCTSDLKSDHASTISCALTFLSKSTVTVAEWPNSLFNLLHSADISISQ